MRKSISILVLLVFMWTGAGTTKAWAQAEKPIYYGVSYASFLLGNLAASDVSSHWAKESLYKMKALGVIRGYAGRLYPNQVLTRQEAVVMLVNLMGKEQEAAQQGQMAASYLKNASPWAAGYIMYLMQQGVISNREMLETDWKKRASRQEVAYWLAKAMGFKPVYGQEQQAVYNFADWTGFEREKVPFIEPVVALGLMQGRAANKFEPNGGMTRAEMSQVLNQASKRFLPQRGYVLRRGSVVYVDASLYNPYADPDFLGSGYRQQIVYHLSGMDGDFSLVAESSPKQSKDFLVFKNGAVGLSGQLKVMDEVEVIANEKGEVLWAQVSNSQPSTLYGILEGVDLVKRSLTFKTLDNQKLSLFLTPDCRVSFDGYPGTLGDLVAGQNLTLRLRGTQVAEILAPFSEAYAGEETYETRYAYGTLLYKSPTQIEVRDDEGQVRLYSIGSGTVFVRDNKVVDLNSLAAGDYLKIHLRGTGETQAVKVEVTGAPNQIYAVYRGKLEGVNEAQGSLSFTDVASYEYGGWKTTANFKTFKVEQAAGLYHNGIRLTLSSLGGGHKGYYCYFATSKAYGEERVVDLVVKTDYEYKYEGKILGTNSVQRAIAMANVPGEIRWDEGTMVIKNGKRVSPESLVSGEQAVVFINTVEDVKRARLIMVDEVEAPSLAIYRGQIKQVRRDYIDINMYSLIVDHEFDRERSTSYENRFEVMEETVILDGVEVSKVKELSKKEFIDRGLKGDFDHSLAYLLSDGRVLVAVNITPKVNDDLSRREYLGERISYGEVESQPKDGKVTLKNLKEWDGLSDEWVQGGTQTLDFSRAVVVQDQKKKVLTSLAPGDEMYVLRSGPYALVAVVR